MGKIQPARRVVAVYGALLGTPSQQLQAGDDCNAGQVLRRGKEDQRGGRSDVVWRAQFRGVGDTRRS